MSEVISCGMILKNISNRAYAKYDTSAGSVITSALETAAIPYFARYTDHELSLTYDSSFSSRVDEIIKKSSSGEYEQLLREIKDRKNISSYLSLLPEISEILEMSVSTLKSRPEEMQEILCKTYTDLWYCDTLTIRNRLSELLMTDIHKEEIKKKHKELKGKER